MDSRGRRPAPAVSVIMPVYNAEPYLEESVGSVLAQSFTDFELICFNDASTDGSAAILRRYAAADGRVRLIDSTVNLRQGGGRNRALDAASGRYVLFLDADDALASDALARCIGAAEASGADAVFFDHSLWAPSRGSEQPVSQLGDDAAGLRGDELRRRIISRTAPLWSAMYARSIITDNALRFPEHVFYEDNAVALAMQLAAAAPMKINATVYRYRTDNQSVTRSANNPRFFDRIDSAVLLLGHLKRLGIYHRFAEAIDFLFTEQYLVHTVFGAIYRFDRVQSAQIRRVTAGIGQYVADYRRNPCYRAQPLRRRLKIAGHIHFPHIIKVLSRLRRRLAAIGHLAENA